MAEESLAPTQGAFWPELVPASARGRGAEPPRPAPRCGQCGEVIPAPAGRRRYCSPACRKLAQAARIASTDAEGGATVANRTSDAGGAEAGGWGSAAPSTGSPPAELTPHRRLVLAWQLLSAYRPAALWQALAPDEQTQATALALSLYQWTRDLEPFARRHRGG